MARAGLIFWLFSHFLLTYSATKQFVSYKQCDPRWGTNEMGVNGPGERATICREGCAMSCVAMGMASFNSTLSGSNEPGIVTPGTLNKWLEENNGYECADGDCNNLKIPIINNATKHVFMYDKTATHPTIFDFRRGLDAQDSLFIAHNASAHHFVLATGSVWSNAGDAFSVNDPFFNMTQYHFKTVESFITYRVMNRARSYPLFKQCDSKWGNKKMGSNGDTICQVGCLMSSVSMAMNAYNIPIEGKPATPGSLDDWLRANNGFESGTSDLIESSLNKLSPFGRIKWDSSGMHTKNDVSFEMVRKYVRDFPRRVVIANVMHGEHFVLITDVNDEGGDSLIVNDPGFDKASYSYKNDVVGWRLFDMM